MGLSTDLTRLRKATLSSKMGQQKRPPLKQMKNKQNIQDP